MVVSHWFRDGKYPPKWTLGMQINGGYAETAAYILRDGNKGVFRWLEEAREKRDLLGNDPKQRDGFDLVDSNGTKIDVKFCAHNHNYIIVTPTTHKLSEYEALVAARFDERLEHVEFFRISRKDFDRLSEDWPGPNGFRKRVLLSLCEKVDKL